MFSRLLCLSVNTNKNKLIQTETEKVFLLKHILGFDVFQVESYLTLIVGAFWMLFEWGEGALSPETERSPACEDPGTHVPSQCPLVAKTKKMKKQLFIPPVK